jgi:hypothetical protein
MDVIENIKDIYSLPGFRAGAKVRQHHFDPAGLIVNLSRRQKKQPAAAAVRLSVASGTAEHIWSETWTPVCGTSTSNSSTAGSGARGARP